MRIENDEYNKCADFAEEFIKRGKSKYKKIKRNNQYNNRIDFEDCLIGKLGEIIFQKLLREKYNIEIELDFEFHNRTDDGQDILKINGEVPTIKYDIKTVRHYQKWILVSEGKSDFFICMKIDRDHEFCDFIGCLDMLNFYDSKGKPWFEHNSKRKDVGKKLLSADFVDKCYDMGIDEYENITYRSQLYKFFKDVKINPKTDFKVHSHNLALPLNYLRDINYIIPVLESDNIDKEIKLRRRIN